jgi:archaellum biogenesis ATPase FlaH
MDNETIFNQALRYHALGFSIIPVGQDKKPLIKWRQYQEKKATPQEIEEWTIQFPKMNIGAVTGKVSGIVVIDVENGGSIDNFPATTTSRTGGLGWHLFYKYPADFKGLIPNSTKKLGEFIDVRADGGYVVLPPSVHASGNSYEWITPPENGLTEIPADLLEKIMGKDLPQQEMLNDGDVPEGMRNSEATKFVGRLLHYIPKDLWDTAGWGSLKEWNSTRANPPLLEGELKTIFASIKNRESSNRSGNAEPTNFTPFTLDDLYGEEFPAVRWVVKDLVPLGTITALTGDSNSYKTFLTQSMAGDVALGNQFLKHFPTTKGKVLIVDEENHRMHIKDRFKQMGISPTKDILFLSLRGVKIDNEYHLQHLKELIEKEKPILVILDSLVRLHSGEENSATEMAVAFSAMKQLVAEDRAILFIHHHRKPQGFGKKSNSQSIRGSSDIIAAVDSHMAIDRKETEFTITQTKMRLQPELKPFKVALVPTPEENLVFSYQGEDTSEEDKMQEAYEEIKAVLANATEPLTIDMLAEEVELPMAKLRQAIKDLLKSKDLIIAKVGAHGAYFYELPQLESESVSDTI